MIFELCLTQRKLVIYNLINIILYQPSIKSLHPKENIINSGKIMYYVDDHFIVLITIEIHAQKFLFLL